MTGRRRLPVRAVAGLRVVYVIWQLHVKLYLASPFEGFLQYCLAAVFRGDGVPDRRRERQRLCYAVHAVRRGRDGRAVLLSR